MRSRMVGRGIALVLVAAAGIHLAACGATTAESDTTAQAAQAAARAKGPIGGVKAAIAALGLRPDQKARTDRAIASVETTLAPVREERRAFASELARGIRSGAIDHARTQVHIDAMVRGIVAARPTFEQALDTLHATLDPEQREALVEALRDGMMERHDDRRERMRELADELGLSPEQRDRLKGTIMAEFKARRAEHKARFGEMRERMRRAAEAFESEHFSAKALGIGEKAPELARAWSQGMVRMVELSLPVLDAGQRQKLATIVERKAAEME